MSVALDQPMSIAAFLEWEGRQESRYEFDGVLAIVMTGSTRAHATIQVNLAIALGTRLSGKPCRFYGSDFKIEAAGSIRYPDGFIACTPGDPKDRLEPAPVVIFELLSESTSQIDLVVKNREYAATPSVQRYVILMQDGIGGFVFERVADDWVGHRLDPDAILDMPELGLAVPLAEFYDGLDFAVAADGGMVG